MEPSQELDVTQYLRSINVNASTAVSLGRRLITAQPQKPTPAIKASAALLAADVETLAVAVSEHSSADILFDTRPIDHQDDNGWGCLFDRLDSYARLPAAHYPKVARAAELRNILYPDGLKFLLLDYGAQYTQTDLRLARIKDDKLQPDLDAIAGPEFLAEVKRTHALYAEALGISKPRAATPKRPDLRPILQKVNQSISAYVVHLCSLYLSGTPAQQAEVRVALQPLDEERTRTTTRRAKPESDPDPAAPVTPPAP
jgi:hypothetical protein